MWGGNNENEVALNWYKESNPYPVGNRDFYVTDYSTLYINTVLETLQKIDPHG